MNIVSKFLIVVGISIACLNSFGQEINKNQKKITFKADSLFDLGYFDLAEIELKNLITKLRDTDFSENSFQIKNKLAECHLRLGNPDLSIAEELEINKQYAPNQNLAIEKANSLNILGLSLMAKGQSDEALEYFQNALLVINEQKKPDNTILAKVYSNIGLAHWYNGNYQLAEEHHQKALQISQKTFGENSLAVATSLNDLGLDYVNNDVDKAILFYEQALKVYQKFYPENHPKIAYAYNNLAIAYRKKKEFPKAMDYLRKIEAIQNALYPQNHPDRAFLLLNIAQTFKEEKSQQKAQNFYQKAILAYQNIYGNKHPEIANIYNELGSLSLQNKQFDKALAHFQLALNANSPNFVSNDFYINPAISEVYNQSTLLATLMQKANTFEIRYTAKTLKINDLKSALNCLETADSLINQLRQIKTNKNDKLYLGNLAVEIYQTGIRIALLLAENTLKPRFYHEKAFYFSEKSKSAVLAEAIAETKAKHFANIPDSLLNIEKKFKSDIAYFEQKIAETAVKAQLDKLRDNLFVVSRQYEKFIKTLETKFPAYYNLKYDVNLPTIDEIQKNLPQETALVSYLIADSSRRIYTFVITENNFKVYDKTMLPDFERWLRQYRNAILYRSETDFEFSASQLYNQLWSFKLASHIKKVIIVQDNKTGSIPFEAFLIDQPSNANLNYDNFNYLVNNFDFSYAFSAHLWLENKKKQIQIKEPSILCFAPISFKYLPDLPGTASEVNEISKLFQNKTLKNTILTSNDASEKNIKLPLLKNYKYLHLATHGMVNIYKPELSAVFLNADSTSKAKEDGMLYSGEIYNLDLKADLVTLSACETGLGKISRGEGIIGLTRALLYAGANNTIVSLWTVSDQSTSELMQTFYQSLLQNNNASYSESLSLAKRQLIKSQKFAAPYYWSAFVLIGN